MTCIPAEQEKHEVTINEAIRKELAAIGRGFQPEFLEMISSNAFDTVYKFLRSKDIPESIIELMDSAIVLKGYARDLETGTIGDMFAIDIVDTLPQITRLIWKAGGEFTDGNNAWSK